ncbi:MAG: hypothetical protein Kow00106_25770 [Anaerolineae bacterium]
MGEKSLERQITDEVRELDPQQQRLVLEYVLTLRARSRLSTWLEQARNFRGQLQAKGISGVDVQGSLDEVRQERLDDLLGSR